MAQDTKIPTAVASLMADAGIGSLANSGKVRIYSGTVPATADTALDIPTTHVLLAELTLAADAFPPASDGLLTANAVASDTSADADGTASFFRVYKSDGTTVLWQGTVGPTSGGAGSADMLINSVALAAGALVSVNTVTYTVDVG